MTGMKSDFEFVDLGSEVNSTQTKSRRMTWIKPEFEFVDLCCEVTLYLHQ
jgi:hypothetical protein